jgi:hypothetical protein
MTVEKKIEREREDNPVRSRILCRGLYYLDGDKS